MGLFEEIIILICCKFIIDTSTSSIFPKKATFEAHITLMNYYFNEIILFSFVVFVAVFV